MVLHTDCHCAPPHRSSQLQQPNWVPDGQPRHWKSKNIENDRPDDNDNNNKDDDVDCFPRQDKQPVLPQDISPNATLRPSLIESPTDKSTDPTDNNNNNKNNNEPSDDDNDDADCFPPQQRVLPQDLTIPPHATNPNDDDDSTVIHDNRYYANSDDSSYTDSYDYDDRHYDDDDDIYLAYSYDTDYKFDYNNPLDADDGDDYDNDDDDDDDSYTYCSSDEDDYYNYNHTPNVIFDMHGNQFTIDDNDNMVPYDDKPMTLQAAQRQINAILAGCNTASSIKEFTDQAMKEYDEFFAPKTAACNVPVTPSPTYANDNHDAFLHHRWIRTNTNKNTSTTRPGSNRPTLAANSNTTSTPIEIPVKDDTSITPTLDTLYTLDTRSSDPTYNDTNAIQYRMLIRSTIRNRSRHPSTAVQYALIGVYDKLLHSRKLPCLLYLFTSIICVVLSCFILLADFFAMVKIDDRYPDEWND